MGCFGDGWHKVGNCKVLVQNRVIVQCLCPTSRGEWTNVHIKRWNKERHTYQRTGMVTLAALRSGIRRGTYTMS